MLVSTSRTLQPKHQPIVAGFQIVTPHGVSVEIMELQSKLLCRVVEKWLEDVNFAAEN
ncbi:hypothetical protein [Bacteroides sp.]|uniref:hypothetical protein n=1 Tax=Bacteroides sp. TaxID=29523 RepID=UPI002A811A51|nr:hypothetical protein [Bacteroides sp.]MEB3376232.1 hypothetical protein [Bacteroides sp. CR5/BHMF/2]